MSHCVALISKVPESADLKTFGEKVFGNRDNRLNINEKGNVGGESLYKRP